MCVCRLPGACCLPDGVCDIKTENDCITKGGFYAGDLTDCSGDLDEDGAPDDCDFCSGDDRADLTGDRKVNLYDFVVLMADLGCTSGCSADINGDGKTDMLDAGILFAAWLCGIVP